MIWIKSLYELCMCLFSSVWTKPFIIFKNSSDTCLFKFWNGYANFNVTFLFPSWQNSLFCFSVLIFKKNVSNICNTWAPFKTQAFYFFSCLIQKNRKKGNPLHFPKYTLQWSSWLPALLEMIHLFIPSENIKTQLLPYPRTGRQTFMRFLFIYLFISVHTH